MKIIKLSKEEINKLPLKSVVLTINYEGCSVIFYNGEEIIENYKECILENLEEEKTENYVMKD